MTNLLKKVCYLFAVILLIVLIILFGLSGCKANQEAAVIEYGYSIESTDRQAPNVLLAYKVSTSEYDCSSVQIEYSIGCNSIKKANIELYMYNYVNQDYKVNIKEIDGDIEEKYSYKITYDNNNHNKGKIEYTHKDSLIIPQELFIGNSGSIIITGKAHYISEIDSMESSLRVGFI
nr:hypothetical protein [Clostridia bacterium]